MKMKKINTGIYEGKHLGHEFEVEDMKRATADEYHKIDGWVARFDGQLSYAADIFHTKREAVAYAVDVITEFYS